MRNVLEDMPKQCNDVYTKYLDQQISKYNTTSINHEITKIEYKEHFATITDKREGKLYKYTVSNINGISCTCNEEKEPCYGCIHCFYACKNKNFGDFASTIHPCFKRNEIQEFCKTLKDPLNLDKWIINEEVIPPEILDKRTNRKRAKDAIDILKQFMKKKQKK